MQCNTIAFRVEHFEKLSAGVSVAAELGTGKRWKIAMVDSVSAENVEFSSRGIQGLNLSQHGKWLHLAICI